METDPETTLALAYAPAGRQRDALAALLALDDALAEVVRTTTQPAIGQIRLAWWREQLAKLDHAPPPAMPVLVALADTVLPLGVAGRTLVPVVEGWEVLIEEEALDDDALRRFGEGRGGGLFAAAATLLGGSTARPATVGTGWALADLARHVAETDVAARAEAMARETLAGTLAGTLNGVPRPLGMLALSARLDLAGTPRGGPRRAARLAWFGLTGR